MGIKSSSGKNLNQWCQVFEKCPESSGMLLFSPFDLSLGHAPWLLWTLTIIWDSLQIRTLEGVMDLEKWEEVGDWLGFTIFSLCLSRSFCPLLTELFELKNNAQRARHENRELLWEQIALEESIKETTRFCGEASMKIRVTSSLR